MKIHIIRLLTLVFFLLAALAYILAVWNGTGYSACIDRGTSAEICADYCTPAHPCNQPVPDGKPIIPFITATMITAEIFKQKTGREPSDDDLERVNCGKAGKLGHWSCGWCYACDKPVFECGHIVKAGKPSPEVAK